MRHRRILGAVLAGGQSRRFGSDKALAAIAGRAMIDHVIAALEPHVDQLLICGRAYGEFRCAADRPELGLGPLGGLCAALHFAEENGLDTVVTMPCDTPQIDRAIIADLAAHDDCAVISTCPVIGVWPARLSADVERYLMTSDDRSMRSFARQMGAKSIDRLSPINVNQPSDLDLIRG